MSYEMTVENVAIEFGSYAGREGALRYQIEQLLALKEAEVLDQVIVCVKALMDECAATVIPVCPATRFYNEGQVAALKALGGYLETKKERAAENGTKT